MTKRLKYTKKPPWLSKEMEEAMHQRDRLLKARKHEEFKKQRSKVTSLIRASKKQQHIFRIESPQNIILAVFGRLLTL